MLNKDKGEIAAPLLTRTSAFLFKLPVSMNGRVTESGIYLVGPYLGKTPFEVTVSFPPVRRELKTDVESDILSVVQ